MFANIPERQMNILRWIATLIFYSLLSLCRKLGILLFR
ncbi:hypothetical protein CWATWH0402_6278 [Crocosphaera watsonii WH 0402]|uniref:Uncharacterized protein n=2 Tax=Crocosphaera watsonii TaxID=263511 RepID=T2JLH0_CROWT|nr:hypothetical protein CWATWH0003_4050 [Crocosphaera watsonii WH 0003]CCQ65921.1 hypothetical protein CWATWH0402_6278 [Crocosphaera watsonii WH 0402]